MHAILDNFAFTFDCFFIFCSHFFLTNIQKTKSPYRSAPCSNFIFHQTNNSVQLPQSAACIHQKHLYLMADMHLLTSYLPL